MYHIIRVGEYRGKPEYVVNGGLVFGSESEARGYCDTMNAHWDAMAVLDQVPSKLSRSEYEQRAGRLHIEAMSDADCDGYAVRYGQYVAPEYETSYCLRMHLALRRARGIDAERAARPMKAASAADYPSGRTLDCGHVVYQASEAMSAGRGTSCPDCYDRMSDI